VRKPGHHDRREIGAMKVQVADIENRDANR